MKKNVIKGISHELRWKMIFIQSQINHEVPMNVKSNSHGFFVDMTLIKQQTDHGSTCIVKS